MVGKWEWRWTHRAPFYFERSLDFGNRIVDAEGRHIAGHIHPDVGLLFAAAPTLYATLTHLRSTLAQDDPRALLVDRALQRADDMEGAPLRPPTPEEKALVAERSGKRRP